MMEERTRHFLFVGIAILAIILGALYFAFWKTPQETQEQMNVMDRITAPEGDYTVDPEVLKRLTAPPSTFEPDQEIINRLTAPQ